MVSEAVVNVIPCGLTFPPIVRPSGLLAKRFISEPVVCALKPEQRKAFSNVLKVVRLLLLVPNDAVVEVSNDCTSITFEPITQQIDCFERHSATRRLKAFGPAIECPHTNEKWPRLFEQ